MKKCENVINITPDRLLLPSYKGVKIVSQYTAEDQDYIILQCCKEADQACFSCCSIVCKECKYEHEECEEEVKNSVVSSL